MFQAEVDRNCSKEEQNVQGKIKGSKILARTGTINAFFPQGSEIRHYAVKVVVHE